MRYRFTHFIAPVACLAGAFGVCYAWQIGRMLPREWHIYIYGSVLCVWLSGCGLLLIKQYYSTAPRRYFFSLAVGFALLSASFIPQKTGQYDVFFPQTLALIAFVLFLWGALRWQAIHSWLARLYKIVSWHQRLSNITFMWIAFVGFLLITVGLSYYLFSFLPTYDDTLAQYFHGKILASGHMRLPQSPFKDFFIVAMTINDGHWYSQYQPLQVLILGLGYFIGTPWLANPLMGALTLLATYGLARRMHGEATARLSAVLTLCSLHILWMSSEYMNHVPALLLAVLFVRCYIETIEDKTTRANMWALGAGFCLGLLFLVRPLSAVGVGLAFAVHGLLLLRKNFNHYGPLFFIMSLPIAPCLMFQAWYNLMTTGNIFIMPYARYHSNKISNQIGLNAENTLLETLGHRQEEWVKTNFLLFEWSVPALLFVLFACLFHMRNLYTRLLLAMALCYSGVNLLNHFYSSVWGPRYLYEISSVIIILIACGLRRIPALLKALRLTRAPRDTLQGLIAAAMILLFIPVITLRAPEKLNAYAREFFHNKHDNYYNIMRQAQKPALVFIEQSLRKNDPKYNKYRRYYSYTHLNPQPDNAPVIFAADLNERNKELIDAYPNRNAYIERQGRLYPIDKNSYSSKAPPAKVD